MSQANDQVVELALVGGGNMGAALLSGLLESGALQPSDVAVVEVREERRDELGSMFPGVRVVPTIPPCRAAVLAVKPADTAAAASAAAESGATRLLSIAAGVGVATLEEAAGSSVAVIRAMPNTPALVGKGTSAIAGGSLAGPDDLDWAESILAAVGIVDRLPESLLDAFTGVSGSGPAYVFLVAEALVDAAIAEGIPADVAERSVTQLLLGAATLLDRDGDPADLRAKVTSPGGTTAAGLAVLDASGVRDAFGAAVRAATERSRELG